LACIAWILQRRSCYVAAQTAAYGDAGTYLDDEDVVSMDSKQQDDGRTYYYYELNASYGTNGPHTYSAVTTKGDLALLFVAAANDKQWASSKDRLMKAAESFRA
jgi:hypothetical protein